MNEDERLRSEMSKGERLSVDEERVKNNTKRPCQYLRSGAVQLANCFLARINGFQALPRATTLGTPTICIGENKGADQLRSNCEADQHLCFRYSDSKNPLLLKSEISMF